MSIVRFNVCMILLFLQGFTVFGQTPANVDSMMNKPPTHKLELKIKQEVSLQANYFMRQFIKPGNADSVTNPYFFTYKIIFLPLNTAIRLGSGYNYVRNEIDQIDEAKLTINRSFYFRAGLEQQFKCGKRFLVFAGVDYVYQTSKNDNSIYNSTEIVTTENTTYQRGGGPTLGIAYRISKHIYLSTESSLYYLSGNSDFTTTYSINSTNNTGYSQKQESILWHTPNVLYCTVRF